MVSVFVFVILAYLLIISIYQRNLMFDVGHICSAGLVVLSNFIKPCASGTDGSDFMTTQ